MILNQAKTHTLLSVPLVVSLSLAFSLCAFVPLCQLSLSASPSLALSLAVSLADGGTEWQPYCGCTRVGFRTAFTSALECADEWAAQPVSGCAAPPATGALAQVAPTPAAGGAPLGATRKLEARRRRAAAEEHLARPQRACG